MTSIRFIPFKKQYLDDCVALFKSNLTGYFSPDEVSDFVKFLENHASTNNYYVGLKEQLVVACGGWDKQTKGFYLRWGIIDSKQHKLGLGSKLLQFRIEKIRELYGNVDIYIKTSGKAHGFFEKFGFQVNQVIPNGIDKGIDEYQMQLQADKMQKIKGR